MKNEQVDEIIEKLDKRIIPKDFFKLIQERPIANIVIGFLLIIGLCFVWFIGGLLVIYFSQ
mgnify:CR=1 FL=1